MESLNKIIFYNLDRTIRTYRNFAIRKLKEKGYNVTIDQWLVLKAISENPGIAQNEISTIVFKDNASVTRMIELLVKANLLLRETHKKDRRKTNLSLTQSALDVLSNMQPYINENRKTALEGIPSEELQHLNEILMKITNNCLKAKS